MRGIYIERYRAKKFKMRSLRITDLILWEERLPFRADIDILKLSHKLRDATRAIDIAYALSGNFTGSSKRNYKPNGECAFCVQNFLFPKVSFVITILHDRCIIYPSN